MTNRIMLRAHADENTIQFRTVSAHMKSPQRFYVTYDELDRLQRDGCIITNDIHSFARLWLDKRRDRITFEFTWLTGRGFDRVEGVEQTIHLRWSAFRAFLEPAASRTASRTSRPSPWTYPAAPGWCSTATRPISAPPSATPCARAITTRIWSRYAT